MARPHCHNEDDTLKKELTVADIKVVSHKENGGVTYYFHEYDDSFYYKTGE